MTDWSKLHHAYGEAADIPALIAALEPHGRPQAWLALGNRLLDQGFVFHASYAALPLLTAKARQWPPVDRGGVLEFAASIVSSLDGPDDAEEWLDRYQAEIAELRELTEESLRADALVTDAPDYGGLVASLLAFERNAEWAELFFELGADEVNMDCPTCEMEIVVEFGEHRNRTYAQSMDVKPTAPLPLRPCDPATAEGPLPRLYARAVADGQPAFAAKLSYAFGEADCAACETPFSIPELVRAWRIDA